MKKTINSKDHTRSIYNRQATAMLVYVRKIEKMAYKSNQHVLEERAVVLRNKLREIIEFSKNMRNWNNSPYNQQYAENWFVEIESFLKDNNQSSWEDTWLNLYYR